MEYETDELFEPIFILRSYLLSFLIFGVILVVIIGFVITRSVSDSLNQLTYASIALGKGQRDYRITINSSDEIGLLAKTFNKMAEQLQQTTVSWDYVNRIIQSMMEGLIVFSPEGKIELVNSAAIDLTGYSEPELIGQPSSLVLQKLDLFNELNTSNNTGPDHIESRISTKEGELIPVLASTSMLKIPGHKSPHMMIVLNDLRELVESNKQRDQMKTQLQQAQKLEAVGQLAAGIAHEINTPAQFVGDNTRFLQDAFVDLQQLQLKHDQMIKQTQDGKSTKELANESLQYAEEIDLEYLNDEIPKAIEQSLEGIGRISKIVKAMKEFAHPGSVDKSPSDINRAIESTVDISRNEWKYVADISLELDPDLPLVFCQVSDINQTLLNLIVNASHAIDANKPNLSSDKGIITINTAKVGDKVIIEVSDNGCGMPAAVRERIFEPFFTTKEVGKGSGQGLSIAYASIVDKHHGAIDVESSPETGTKFTIRLPINPSKEESST